MTRTNDGSEDKARALVNGPVCGMNVEEKTAAVKSKYMGKTYYFCNQSCALYSTKIRRDSLTNIQNMKDTAVAADEKSKPSIIN